MLSVGVTGPSSGAHALLSRLSTRIPGRPAGANHRLQERQFEEVAGVSPAPGSDRVQKEALPDADVQALTCETPPSSGSGGMHRESSVALKSQPDRNTMVVDIIAQVCSKWFVDCLR